MRPSLLRALGGLALLLAAPSAWAQVGIGTLSPDASAVLDLKSTSQGLLAPRMTAAQVAAIANPADGLLVYRTDGLQPGLVYYKAGSGWTYVNPTGADNLGNHLATQGLNMNGNAISFGTALTQQLNLWSTDYGIGIQPYTLSFRSGSSFVWYKGGSYVANQNDPGAGGALQMLLTENGDIGIGTASPQARLHVGGNLRLDGGIIQIGGAPITGTSDLGLYSRVPGNWMRFVTNGAPFRFYADDNYGSTPNFSIEANGNVGIGMGTATATNRLDLQTAGRSGTHATGRVLYATGNFSEAANGVEFRHSNATQGIGLGYNSLYAAGTNPDQHLNLMPKGTGGVGIGTTAPRGRLDVASGDTYLVADPNNGTAQNLYLPGHVYLAPNTGSSGTAYVQARVPSPTASTNLGFSFRTTNGGNLVEALQLSSNGTPTLAALAGTGTRVLMANASGTLSAQTVASVQDNLGNHTATQNLTLSDYAIRLRGSSDANHQLRFDGTVNGPQLFGYQGGELGYNAGAGYQPVMRWNELGRVGIGTASPSQKLEVAGQVYSSTGGFRFPDNTVQTTAATNQSLSVSGQTLSISGGNAVTLPVGADNLGNHTATQNLNLANKLLVGNGGTSGLAVASDGSVGIGTASPQGRLDVASGSVRLPGGGGSDTWFNYSGNGQNYLRGTTILADLGGYVGIGTSSPSFPLDVQSTVSSNNANYVYYGANGQNGLMGYAASGGSMSIRAAGRVVAPEFNATSDRRLKTVIGLSDRAADLALLQQIRITDYTMRDRVQYGERQFKKVIAQEVEQVFPQAVNRQTGFLPDVYALANSATAEGELLCLTLPQALAAPAAAGQRLKLMVPQGEVVGTVAEPAAGRTLLVRGAAQLAGQQVFVFGLEHQDVRTVDYEALAMLNVSATQELARQVAELQKQNAALRQQNQTQTVRLDLQQASMQAQAELSADLAQRLQALENMLGTRASAK